MRASAAIVLLLATGCASRGVTSVTAQASTAQSLELSVDPRVSPGEVRRVGVNLGGWTSWGAEQLAANVIKNPGFEGVIDRGLATVKTPRGNAFTVEGYQTRPEGFWQGAGVDLRTGPAAGETARIIGFHVDSGNQRATVETEPRLQLADGDVVAFTKTDSSGLPTQWWIPEGQPVCGYGPARPASPGRRSLRLCPSEQKAAEVNSFLDGIGNRAGKLLPVDGKWRLSFWLRDAQGGTRLQVSLQRQPSSRFFERELRPSHAWRQVVIEFDGHDNGPAGMLQLQFLARGRGQLDLDDVSLIRARDGEFPFRAEVVEVLERLHPAYLRDWQGQLGDTVSNRLASPFARQASRYRSARREDAGYGYSLPEFFELCSRISASPWIVIPTTASDDEYRALGRYLRKAQTQFHFAEILVEFGNENWNPLFGAAGIADSRQHSEVASRSFSLLGSAAGLTVPLLTVINAQFVNPHAVAELAGRARADMVAVAPYFAFNLPADASASQTGKLLFTPSTETWRQISAGLPKHTELSVYEVNLHTVGGDAPSGERNDFVLSTAAGTALGQRLMEGMEAGVRRQCVYSLAGYDTFTNAGRNLVQLFGLTRDLTGDARLRSTGLAVMMLNQAVQPELHQVSSGSPITALAFHGAGGWSAAIASSSDDPTEVNLHFPDSRAGTTSYRVLTLSEANRPPGGDTVAKAGDPGPFVAHATALAIDSQLRFPVPARGFVTLLPGDDAAKPGKGVGR